MSRSEPPGDAAASFDAWIADAFAETGAFTALVVLVAIGDLTVKPLRSTWFHVIGTDLDWAGVAELLSGAGGGWDGAVFAPRTDPRLGGPLADAAARAEVLDLGQRIVEDRTVLNAENFFDRLGRRLKIEEVPAQ